MKQWDLESNNCIRTFQGHRSPVVCLAATVDADRLLSNGYVLLWDIATGQQLASVNAHSNLVSCLAPTPDANSFVSGSWDHSLKLWCFKALQKPVIQFSGQTSRVSACAVSSDGSRLYSSSLDKINVWDMTTGQQLASMQSHTDRVSSLALTGSLLVSGSWDGTVKLWDTGSMQLLHALRGFDVVYSVAVTSDGSQRVLSGGRPSSGDEIYDVCVWDAASGAQLAVLQGHSQIVCSITVSADGCLAASIDCFGAFCLWDLTTSRLCTRPEGLESCVISLLFV